MDRDQWRAVVFPHVVCDPGFWNRDLASHDHEDMLAWCVLRVGARDHHWGYHGAGRWSFADAGDAVLFSLVWA